MHQIFIIDFSVDGQLPKVFFYNFIIIIVSQ